MRKLIGAFILAATLAACGQATAPQTSTSSEPAPASDYSTDDLAAPADPAGTPADGAEPSTEAPGYSPPQD